MDAYEFVKAVFALFPADKEFRADNESIHTGFYKARTAYPEELGTLLLFRKQFPFPWSYDVDHCISTLSFCEMFSVVGPWLRTFVIREKLHGQPNESSVSDEIVGKVSRQLQEDLNVGKDRG